MDWLNKGLAAAQQAAQQVAASTGNLNLGETAEKARVLAQQAKEQALALAQEASAKAQEVAKEAISEAEKGLTAIKAAAAQGGSPRKGGAAGADPLVYGITNELQQFVASLTYITFSDFPMETLPTPEEAGNTRGRLSPWQEAHARLMLERVPQLRDLRFVLCPKKIEEYDFWMVYFTLCRRYLPKCAFEAGGAEAAAAAGGGGGSGSGGAGPSGSRAAAAAATSSSAAAAGGAAAGGAAAAAPAAAGSGAGGGEGSEEGDGVDALAELEGDPELDAYLQEALALGTDEGGEGGSDVGDLDDYINALDAEVNTKQ